MTDLKELVTTERFREIHQARQQCITDEREINRARSSGRISEGEAIRHYQRSVKSFVRELETLLNPLSDDPNQHWDKTSIGTVNLPDGRTEDVRGLGEFLEVPEDIAVEMQTEDKENYYEISEKTSKVVTTQPSWQLVQSAFRVANHALADLNMEIDPDESGSDVWEFREIKDKDEIDADEWSEITFNKSNGADES